MENLRETEKIYHNEVEQNIGKIFHPEKKTIDITKLKLIPSPEAVLFEILKEYGFNRDTIQNIAQAIDSQSGKKFYSNQFTLLKNRNEFILFPSKKESTENIIFIEKELSVIKHPIHLEMDVLPINNFKGIEKNKNNAYFDFDKLSFPLHLRKWKKGDKFKPFGMDNFQKLSDFFNNQKFSHIEKESCWLLCSEKNIIWIVGERTDNRYKVTETTQNIYQMKFF
jgi:tRNA(Ile)-lysidine synthase